ncbi:MAG: heavy-metal-associated domain-containing protein [Rhodothermaceae bacterium]
MKKLLVILSVIFLFAACKTEPKAENVKYLTSLHCEGCKQTISNKLNKTEGILSYNVEVPTKIVSIEYDANVTDSLKLKNLLIDLGYSANKIN